MTDDYNFHTTEEVPIGDGATLSWIDGWVPLIVNDSEVRTSTGGYSQIVVSFAVSDGPLTGKKTKLFMTVPPKDRAFTSEGALTWWGRKFVWFLQAFDLLPDGKPYPPDNEMLDFLVELDVIDKCVVAEVKAGEATVNDQKTGEPRVISVANIERLHRAGYVPDEGFIDDAPQTPTPPVRQPEHSSTDITPEMSRNPADVPLDPDVDLEEEEDFFVE